ncbi:hypothetical protein ALC60_11226 [Trachymyrmex zeteki]|uniref:Uncharacterized protein n=1 Tax=Mycetomoellerius zeteki TaxID=64791 RepID=A0A151WP63_9HYME|nr:hypothetical protein ALC60_11226 [Trachymyrmex zeteki]
MSSTSCACTITTSIITVAGNAADAAATWKQCVIYRDQGPGINASVGCVPVRSARTHPSPHAPHSRTYPPTIIGFPHGIPPPFDLMREGKPGKVGSSPDRIMMDQEAKTYHLYLPSFLASTVHLTLSEDQPMRGRPSKSSLQIPILSRLRAQELEDFVLFLECYFVDAM